MNAHSTDSAHTGRGALPIPNHHATHPGFSGPSGLLAAVSFLFGRDRAAQLAIELSELRSGDRLVDVGCGPGIALRRARALGAEAIGIDPAQVMLRVARVRMALRSRHRLANRDRRIAPSRRRLGTSRVVTGDRPPLGRCRGRPRRGARRVLVPGGRLVVLERRILDTDARGTASHGWTPEQSESFAEHCRRQGFANVTVSTHAGRTTILSVVAQLPETEHIE